MKATLGWRAVRVVAERDGRMLGGAQILFRDLPGLGAVGYVSRGPVLDGDDPEVGALVLDEVERVARELRIAAQQPGDLRRGEVGVQEKPCAFAQLRLCAGGAPCR